MQVFFDCVYFVFNDLPYYFSNYLFLTLFTRIVKSEIIYEVFSFFIFELAEWLVLATSDRFYLAFVFQISDFTILVNNVKNK